MHKPQFTMAATILRHTISTLRSADFDLQLQKQAALILTQWLKLYCSLACEQNSKLLLAIVSYPKKATWAVAAKERDP